MEDVMEHEVTVCKTARITPADVAHRVKFHENPRSGRVSVTVRNAEGALVATGLMDEREVRLEEFLLVDESEDQDEVELSIGHAIAAFDVVRLHLRK
jgi:hypothetical protein